MGWNNRSPSPLDPDADPLLPQADTSQGHDIPTGISPTTAKLQDWTAWLRANGVFYDDPIGDPGVITGDMTIGGDLTVADDVTIASSLDVGTSADIGTDLTVGDDASISGTLTVLTGIDCTGPVNVTGNIDASGYVDTASYVVFSGTQPASNVDPGENRAHAMSLVKVSGTITTSGGTATVQDGLGIASASASAGGIRVTFARAFSSINYTVTATSGNGGDEYCIVSAGTSTASFVDIAMRSVSTGAIDPTATSCVFFVHITGRH
jgi:hypothetical protein